MKTRFWSLGIALLLLWLTSAVGYAQQDDRCNNNFGFSVEGAFSHLFLGKNLNPMDNYAKPSWGGGGGAAFIYELQYKHFLFRTGFGVNYTYNINHFESPNYTLGIREYPTMQYHYNFSHFTEKTTYGIGYVPVYFGGLFKRFFFLVGAKIGVLPFYGFTRSTTDMTISATDIDVIDPMENLSSHQMGNSSIKSPSFPMEYQRLNIMGSLELGINLDPAAWKQEEKKTKIDKAQQYRELHRRKSFKERQHYRLSFFLDYGLTNILSYRANPVPNLDTQTEDGGLYAITSVNDVTPGSIFGYQPHAKAVLHNMQFGVKFAIMFELPHKAPTKGAMANPAILTYVTDEKTGKPLAGALVRTESVPKGKGKARVVEKTTDAKRGRVMRSYPVGDYIISVSKSGYFPEEPFTFTHRDDYDTLHIALYPQQTLRMSAVDAKSERPIPASITLTDQDGNTVASGTVDSLNTTFSSIVDGRKQLTICASGEGYKDTCIRVQNINEVLRLQIEPKVIRRFVLKEILFAKDKNKVLPSSKPALIELCHILQEHADMRIRIIGHTDDTGREEYNQKLSVIRANSVKSELVKLGVDPSRVEIEGRGENDPIVPNDSDQHRQMNRRVEVEILGGDYIINSAQQK